MDEWVWSNGGMILTGEKWSTGRKTLYSGGGRWMNEYGAMGELYWQRKTEVLGDKRVPVPLCTPQIQNGLPLNYIYFSLRTMVVGNKSTTRVFSTKSKFIYLWCHFPLALGKNEDQGLGIQTRWSRSLRGRSRNLIEKGVSQDHDSSGVGNNLLACLTLHAIIIKALLTSKLCTCKFSYTETLWSELRFALHSIQKAITENIQCVAERNKRFKNFSEYQCPLVVEFPTNFNSKRNKLRKTFNCSSKILCMLHVHMFKFFNVCSSFWTTLY